MKKWPPVFNLGLSLYQTTTQFWPEMEKPLYKLLSNLIKYPTLLEMLFVFNTLNNFPGIFGNLKFTET